MALSNAQLRALRDAVDSDLAALFATIKAKQDAFFVGHGRYWHGRRTGTAPVDGVNASFSKLDEAPPNETESWADFAGSLGTRKFTLQVDRYESPQGHGWFAQVWIRVNGELWTRVKGEGPENFDRPWTNLGAEVAGGIREAKS